MLALVFSRRAIRLGWFWFCVELLCLLGTSGHISHLCYPHCSCHEGSMTCHWPHNISMDLKNGTETLYIYGMTHITCNMLTSEHPIDIHFVKSDIDFIPTCMFRNVTIVNLLFSESKIRIIRCMEFFRKSIETVIFHKSQISSIQPYAFTGSKIKNLFITQSTINRIDENAFYRSSLKSIAFVEDAIHYMSSGLFSSSIKNILSTFILYQCDIFYIGCQKFLPSSFALHKNKMTCDAQLHWLLKRLHGRGDLADNTCRRPQTMIGRTLAQLDLKELCWPPHTCPTCPSAKMQPSKIKCLHISGSPEHHLSKKSSNSNRNPSSKSRKRMKGLKQNINFVISNRSSKRENQTKPRRTPTFASSISFLPDINEMEDVYLHFNSGSVPLDNSTPINHIGLKGKGSELKLDGKTEFSAPNHTLDLINNVKETQYPQGSAKGHSNTFTPSKNFEKKHTANAKMKFLESNDVSVFHVSKKQNLKEPFTPPEDLLLNNNSMGANGEEKVEFFVLNGTEDNVNHVKEELRPERWQKLYLKVNHPLSLSILKPLLQNQNYPDSVHALHDLWKKVGENGGKCSQSNNKVSKGLLIQTMTVLKKVYHVMPIQARAKEES